jgi:sarcosine oxidase subunit alpha
MSVPGLRHGLRLEDERLEFNFDRRTITAQRGDTAASALLANGVRLMARSIKYRRPRGLLCAGPEEPNALFAVGTAPLIVPNVPAPQLLLRPGLRVASQNRWPTLRYDLAALLQLGGGFFGAGFYYKTFIWPSWRAWEGIIRRLAGQGPAPGASELAGPAIEHLACDVLVAGAGAAGLSAALAAARAGARVVLCEREVACGGELEFESAAIEGTAALAWVAATVRELRARAARVLISTAVVGGSNGGVYALAEAGGLPGSDRVYRIRPRALVVAMGAVERPIAFVDNDRPGVMLLGAAERYLARYGVCVGRAAVLFGNHDRLYAAAARLAAGGVAVRAVIDTRIAPDAVTAAARQELARTGVECLAGHAVLAAFGRHTLGAVQVAPLAAPQAARTIACDSLLVAAGRPPCMRDARGGTSRLGSDPPSGGHAAGLARRPRRGQRPRRARRGARGRPCGG